MAYRKSRSPKLTLIDGLVSVGFESLGTIYHEFFDTQTYPEEIAEGSSAVLESFPF